MGPDTAILLQQKLEQGEWIVIVGDRTSTSKESRSVWAEFLGKKSPLPSRAIYVSLCSQSASILYCLAYEMTHKLSRILMSILSILATR